MLQNWIVGNCSSSHKGQLRWRLPSGDATPQPAQASGSSSLAGRFMSTTKGSQRPFLPGFRNQHFSVLRSHGREKFLRCFAHPVARIHSSVLCNKLAPRLCFQCRRFDVSLSRRGGTQPTAMSPAFSLSPLFSLGAHRHPPFRRHPPQRRRRLGASYLPKLAVSLIYLTTLDNRLRAPSSRRRSPLTRAPVHPSTSTVHDGDLPRSPRGVTERDQPREGLSLSGPVSCLLPARPTGVFPVRIFVYGRHRALVSPWCGAAAVPLLNKL